MSAEKDQDYFCEGTSEEIINTLCGISGLRVASRSASSQLKHRAMDSREIGLLLNVQSFLEGSVRKSGDRLRITAQLINAEDGFHLWSQTFDRKIEDIFAVQEEIARHIVEALRVTAEIQPDDYRPIVLTIQEYQALKDSDKEKRSLQRSWQALQRHMQLDPHDSYAADHAAGVLMLLGRRDEANAYRAIALRPDDYGTLYTAAVTATGF